MTSPSSPESPAGPPVGLSRVVDQVFGTRRPLAEAYAALLAGAGVERGLIGPREAPRLWDRHLLNCAVLGGLLPDGVAVVDVGSGAGLPGLVLAIARPDLQVTLLEPLARRVAFLEEAVALLGLGQVTIVRGRAEDVVGTVVAPVVTARAVAPLDRLAAWCLPLCAPGGRLLAMKGSSAAAEITEHAAAVARLGGGPPRIVEVGKGTVDSLMTVVEVPLLDPSRIRSRRAAPPAPGQGRRGRRG